MSNAILKLPSEKTVDPAAINRVIPVLNSLSGIHSVEINHVTNTVSIQYDESKLTVGQIKAKLLEAISGSGQNDWRG